MWAPPALPLVTDRENCFSTHFPSQSKLFTHYQCSACTETWCIVCKVCTELETAVLFWICADNGSLLCQLLLPLFQITILVSEQLKNPVVVASHCSFNQVWTDLWRFLNCLRSFSLWKAWKLYSWLFIARKFRLLLTNLERSWCVSEIAKWISFKELSKFPLGRIRSHSYFNYYWRH